MTRPRPGIDRVSSAWLIRRFIGPKARFVFGTEPVAHPDAIPFDMFVSQGFGHRGEDCTFETLYKQFAIRDVTVKRIAQIIHDADLGDEKFGRAEGLGLDKVLNGWAKQDLPDDELLQRGMDLIEGLYESLAGGIGDRTTSICGIKMKKRGNVTMRMIVVHGNLSVRVSKVLQTT